MSTLEVELPNGTIAELPFDVEPPQGRAPRAALALAHGAGSGREHPLLIAYASALRAVGIATLRFDFAYRAAGRRMPGPASHAVAAWAAVGAELDRAVPGVPLIAAGKSYGGRMASMAAAEGRISPGALVYLGYPLHPPGKPEASRVAHLPAITAPQLFLAGSNDPFLQPLDGFAEAVAMCRRAEVVWTPGGGHSFEVAGMKRTPDEIGAALAGQTLEWLAASGIVPAAS